MAVITYYIALPFNRDDEGTFTAGAKDRQTADSAVRFARALATTEGGAVAFSRTGDPAVGELEDAVILARFGETPDDLMDFTGS